MNKPNEEERKRIAKRQQDRRNRYIAMGFCMSHKVPRNPKSKSLCSACLLRLRLNNRRRKNCQPKGPGVNGREPFDL